MNIYFKGKIQSNNIDQGKDSRRMSVEDVVEKLVEYGQKLNQKKIKKKVDFVNAEITPEKSPANKLLLENPFAFLLGVIYDQGQQAERAWYYPYQLKERICKLEPKHVATISLQYMDDIFKTTKPLLFYWRTASVRTLRAAYRVCNYYDGDTSQIWLKDYPSPAIIQQRFKEFDGIAQKKASMAVNILYRDLGWLSVAKEGLKKIDVSNDRHVRRVFLRSGILDTDDEAMLVGRARELFPEYPGALDMPSWIIGREFCSNNAPNCIECPISKLCAKRTQYEVT